MLKRGDWGDHAMAFTASPAEHVLIVVRERITEQLACEGHSENTLVQADQLAQGLWIGRTVDLILGEVKDILPRSEFLGVLAFCCNHYPILYTSLPSEITGRNVQQISWSINNSERSMQHVSWPQHVPYTPRLHA